MQLIKNQKEFDEIKSNLSLDRRIEEQPKEFPCWLDWYVTDWNYQIETAVFYFADTLKGMLAELASADAAQDKLCTDAVHVGPFVGTPDGDTKCVACGEEW